MPLNTGPLDAKIMVVAEFPGVHDQLDSDYEFTRMLQESGILRTACRITTILNERPRSAKVETVIATKKKDITSKHVHINGKWVLPEVADGIARLKAEIALVKPNVIIAMGNLGLWALTGLWGVGSWRGSCLEYKDESGHVTKVIPIYSSGVVFRQWSWRGIIINDLKRANAESTTAEYTRPDYKFIIRPTFHDVVHVLENLQTMVEDRPTKLSVDVETRAGHLACTGIAWSKLDTICIPHMDSNDPEGYFSLDEEAEICWRLYHLLTHPNAHVIGQNFLYDAQYFYRHFLFIPNLVRDTMVTQHTCFSTMQKGLDFLSSMYCDHHVYWKDEGKEWNHRIPEDQYWTYNCKDAVITFEIAEVEEKIIQQMKLDEPDKFQQSMFWPLLRTMNRGVAVDLAKRQAIHDSLRSQIAELEAWINDVVGHPVNVRSPAQMKELFYRDLQQPVQRQRKTGGETLDEVAMQKLGNREPLLRPLIDAILKTRQLGVLCSTFIDAELDHDQRMRCSYNLAGTDTYRLASRANAFGSGTNLQNFPEEAKVMLVPDPDKEFFDLDLGSADLRIVVWESGEEEMKSLLKAGLNPYVEIAKEYYRDPSITKEHPKYRIFKSFAHGTHYLGTPEGMAGKLGMLVTDVERLQRWYFNRFPRIKQWQERFVAKVHGRHMVENVFGYRYYIFDRIEGNVINQAIAWLPQSTIAILINKIWHNLDAAEQAGETNIEILLQVHDSLAGQFPIAEREASLATIAEKAQIILPYADPLIIPIGVKTSTKSWGECK